MTAVDAYGDDAWWEPGDLDQLDGSFEMWEPEEPESKAELMVHVAAWMLNFAPELEGEGGTPEDRFVNALMAAWSVYGEGMPTDGGLTGPLYIQWLKALRNAIDEQLEYVVGVALREFDVSFAVLGKMLGTSRQNAQNRYKNLRAPHHQRELMLESDDVEVEPRPKKRRGGSKHPAAQGTKAVVSAAAVVEPSPPPEAA